MIALALRGTFRQKTRSGLTLAAIAIGVAALILAAGFVEDVLIQLRDSIIHSQTGHIQVHDAGYRAGGGNSLQLHLIDDPHRLRGSLQAMPHVTAVLARLALSGLLSNGRADVPVIVEGIEPSGEARMNSATVMIAGNQLQDRGEGQIIVGEGVASALRLEPGDRVSLLANSRDGALNSLEFEVAGVFRSFSREFDARAVRVTLTAAQELVASPAASALVMLLDDTSHALSVSNALQSWLPAQQLESMRWDELADFYSGTAALYERQFGVLRIIVLILILFSVTNSINMSMFERIGEFGTMRALGTRNRRIFGLILAESAVLGLTGAALGAALGIALAQTVSLVGIPMPPPPNSNLGYTAQIRIVPEAVATAVAVGLGATTLAALWPAYRISRTALLTALRANV